MAGKPRTDCNQPSPRNTLPSSRRKRVGGRGAATSAWHGKGKLQRARLRGQPAKAPRPAPSTQADESNEGKYVYCVIKSEQPLSFGLLGIGPEPSEVLTVHYRDIAAIVSSTPMVVQDPTRDNVLAHQRVNETVMQDHKAIPISFGTAFTTADDIVELLR